MSGKVVGNDGRLYFEFGVGAQFQLYDEGEPIAVIEIKDCYLDEDGQERYYVQSHGKRRGFGQRSMLLGRMEYLFSLSDAEELSVGIAEEYPLQKEEVRAFFYAELDDKRKAVKAANRKLKKNEQNAAQEKAKYLIEKELAEKIAGGCSAEDISEVLNRYKQWLSMRRETLEKEEIDLKVFEPIRICPRCKNEGVDENGQICICALMREEEIKTWNATERLKRRYAEEWVTYVEGAQGSAQGLPKRIEGAGQAALPSEGN